MSKKKQKKSGTFRKFVWAFIGVAGLSALIGAFSFYRLAFSPNIRLAQGASRFIYIPTGSNFTDVMKILQAEGHLQRSEGFAWLAGQMHYTDKIKPGRYELRQGMNNRQLISMLRSGRQSPLKLTFTNIRTAAQLAGIVGNKIEADSGAIISLLQDNAYLERMGFNRYNSLAILLPNTYEMYWNTSAEQFIERMYKEYNKFWTTERKEKAAALALSPQEVSVLASIVEQETRKNDEKPTIAGVYLNRLKSGWHLEADPTLVYALGDFTVRRVLNEYKLIDSPYNTYMYGGLPPGPICMPSVSSLDAVLNYQKHQYMYFCAREDFSGYHSFATTYSQHQDNARRFQRELNRRGIRS